MSSDTFGSLGVPTALVTTLAERGITSPTPIQAATLPDSLAGRDVLGRGRTGSGKTYAFLLPIVARLTGGRRTPKRPRALILAPTRELVNQINDALAPLAATTGLTSQTIFGGVGQNPQVNALRKGVDIIVACPGRLEDLLGQGHLSLDAVSITVLDEADHMADLGFLPAVRRLLDRTPGSGQRMMFSATLDKAVNTLVTRYLHKAVTHEADSAQSPVAAMDHHVLHVTSEAHPKVLLDLAAAPGRTVIFTRTKHRAKSLTRKLNGAGVPAVELHGNLSQNARTRMMDAFQSGEVETLVATDIAARGIHVDDVSLVVHADPPAEHKAYLHRSGRTARAGAAGTVITLMTDAQRRDVNDLMRKAGIRPTTTVAAVGHPVLQDLAPGERTYPGGRVVAQAVRPAATAGGGRRGGRGRGANRSGNSGSASNAQTPAQRTRARANNNPHRTDTSSGSGGRGQNRRSSGGAAAVSARMGRR